MLRSIWLRFRSKAKRCLPPAVVVGLALSLPLLGWVAQLAAQGMALPGKLEVTPTGAASYTIPIAVPPGTGGMVPSLSIAYNSQARNGLLGVGWHLEGLPSIGRCPRTIAQDGVRGSVNYDADDRFCLDGQRLVAISGTYGADGTEYRTEIESFSKVISHGTAGTGPAWFEVWTKSGQRMEFGNTTDSRVLAQGKTTVRDWVVNKVADTAGNYFAVTYVNDTTNGQVYPDRIDYTGNAAAGLTPYSSVRFVYDTARSDVVPVYHLGSLQKTTVRLAKVQTYAGSTLVADYQLTYELSPITSRSRLGSVALCTGGGACLPATTFNWSSGTLTPTVVTNVAGQDTKLSGYRSFLADFDGDGLTDILWDSQDNSPPRSTGTRVLWRSTGKGSFVVDNNFAGQDGSLSGYVPIVDDFNRDGKADTWWFKMNSDGEVVGPTTRWSSTSSGVLVVSQGPALVAEAQLLTLGDFNGDGRSDSIWGLSLLLTQPDGSASSKSIFGFPTPPPGGLPLLCAGSIWLDYNGDGLTDALCPSLSGSWTTWRNEGGAFKQISATVDSTISEYSHFLLDANGDGNTDVLWYRKSNGKRVLWLSKGDGSFISQSNVSGQDGTLADYTPYVADFNGDGLPDILWHKVLTPRVLWVGKGDGMFTVVPNFGGSAILPFDPVALLNLWRRPNGSADFNGDGKTDLLLDTVNEYGRSTGSRALWLSDGVPTDLVTSVATGIGASATITYKSLTDATVYTRDSTAADPVVDLQTPMFAVSRVDAANGIGGTLSTGYAYAGAKADLNGRGFLGFRHMTVTDLQTGLVQTKRYRQDYPYIGLVADETQKLGAVTLSSTTHAYDATALGGTRFQPFLVQSQAASADLDGTTLPTVTSTYKYDNYGSATEIVVSATDGFSKTTVNTYDNDTAKWHLGRLTKATVTSLITSPGPPPPPPEASVTISGSTNNLNLWAYLVANSGAQPGVPGSWTVTINADVIIGSISTSLPALDTGTFPAGSSLKIINNGTVVGAGGKGGSGGQALNFGTCIPTTPTTAGATGGPALKAQVAVTIVNNGSIWGGGGGGGGSSAAGTVGGSGGGGAGNVAGLGGTGSYPGSPGALTAGGAGGVATPPGGAGGNPGLTGAGGTIGLGSCGTPGAAGAAGAAVTGNTFITWLVTGDRKGPLN